MSRSLALGLLFALTTLTTQNIHATTISNTFEGPGVWTTDWDSAAAYALANQTFFLLNYGQTSGCAICDQAAKNIYDTPEFKAWAIANKIAIVYIDYNNGSMDPLVRRFKTAYPGTYYFPTVTIVDGLDGVSMIGQFRTAYQKTYNGVTLDPLNTTKFAEVVYSFVNPYYNPVGDDDSFDPADDVLAGASPLALSLAYQSHGPHTLKNADTNDWFALTNLEAGSRYRVSATNVTVANATATLSVFLSRTAAVGGAAWTNISLEAAAKGLYFDASQSGTGYVLAARGVATNANVSYSLGYRKVDTTVLRKLVVNDGSGAAETNELAEGTDRAIAAPATKGQFFMGWTKTPASAELGAGFDASQASTTVTMPAYNVTLVATYGTETRVIALAGSFAFGNVRTNQTVSSTLTVSNSGNRPLNVSAINCPVGFSATPSAFAVAAGGSSSVTVSFSPASVGPLGGNITVESDKTAGTETIACSGVGVDNQAPIFTSELPAADPGVSEGRIVAFSVTANDSTDPMADTRGMASITWLVDGVEKKTYTNGAPGAITSTFSMPTDKNTVSNALTREILVKAVASDKAGGSSEASWLVVVTNLAVAQTITFLTPAVKAIGDADFDPGAKATSGLAVEYTSGNEAVATVVGGLVQIVGAGTAEITASQPGNYDYKAATPVKRVLTVKARVTAEVPEGGGSVTGAGLYSPGAAVTLTAAPSSGYTLLNWEDGSQATTRKLVMPNANVTVAAHFGLTAAIAAPEITNPGALRMMVGVAVTQALTVTSASLPTVTVTGLPYGLSYSAAAKAIVGVPAASVTNKLVTITAKNAGGTSTGTFLLTVDPLPAWAQGNFNGSFSHGELGNGLAVMDVTKLGKVTGKLSTGGSNYLFSAASYARRDGDGAFWVSVDAKNGTKATLPLLLKVAPAVIEEGGEWLPETIAAAEGRFGSREDGLPDAALYRNIWKDTGMVTVLTNRFVAYYTATLPVTFDEPVIVSQAAPGVKTDTGASAASVGSGYLAFTVDKTGVVKTAGKLADGTAVTLSGTLVADGAGRTWTVLYYAPLAYKGGQFFGLVEFVKPAEGGPVFVRPLLDSTLQWTSLNPLATAEYGTGFARETGVVGGWYDKVGNLYAYYAGKALSVGTYALADAPQIKVGAERYDSVWWNPAGLSLTAATNSLGVMTGLKAPAAALPTKVDGEYVYDAATNTVGMTFTLARATGLYSGTFKAWFDYGTETVTHTSRSLSFQGILTPVREDPADGVEGRGHFLWSDQSEYLNSQNVTTTYSFKWSYDFVIESTLLP